MFTPSGLGAQIFSERYSIHPEESWREASFRVSRAIAANENQRTFHEKRFYTELVEGRFMPGGRIWKNAGTSVQSLLNCFVVPTQDSIQGWGKTVSDLMTISSVGGGVGMNFSPIRGRGAPISRGGESTGSVSLMEVCNSVGDVLRAGGGRRVAMMHALAFNHPDAAEFISAKLDKGKLTNANVSVIIPPDAEYGDISGSTWDTVVENAWQSGEPGILNQKLAEEMSNVHYAHDLTSTNPCVTGDTVIMTVNGPRRFDDLAASGRSVLVHAWHPETKKPVIKWMRNPHKTRENTKILEVEFDSGLKVRCTPDHNFYSFRGKKVQAKDLKVGKSVRAWSMSQHRDGHFRVHSWNSETNSADHQWVARMVWEAWRGKPIGKGWIVHHIDGDPTNNEINNLEIMSPLQHNQTHYPDRLANGFDGTCKNHKVVGIRTAGYADVYNGCVDDAHSYIILDPNPVAGVASGIVSANCGEIWLPDYGCCCLGALVLPRFVHNGVFQWDAFEKSVRSGVRFLDNVLDINDYPLAETRKMCLDERRIGLGIMGLHTMLLELGIKYSEGFTFVNKLFSFMSRVAYDASGSLAKEKGAFPLWSSEMFNSGYYRANVGVNKRPMRNCAVLTCAPTGTTAMVHGTSSGIEPIFAARYIRRRYTGENLTSTLVYSPEYQKFGDMAESALEIAPEDHLKMQTIVQKYVDNAVSKTINLPNDYRVEDLKGLVERYIPELKGLTFYRQGSRGDEPLELVKAGAPDPVTDEVEFVSTEFEDPCVGGICAL